MVPGAGIEPARPLGRGILSPLRLPISPPGLNKNCLMSLEIQSDLKMEAEPGVEPRSTALQAAA